MIKNETIMNKEKTSPAFLAKPVFLNVYEAQELIPRN
jgi:hypothetical protein